MKSFTISGMLTVFAAACVVLNCGTGRASDIRKGLRYDMGICTDKGMVNPENEDTCGMFTVGRDIVCVVCDGVGGAAAGSTASRMAFKALKEYLENNGSGPGIAGLQECLAAAFAFADRRVRATAASDSLLNGMATTCLVSVLRNDTLYYCHAGDSRLYVGGPSGLKQMTEDDSYINMLLADGEITEREARRHPLRRAIINAIGSKSNEAYVNFCKEGVPVSDGVYFLMCSDGLYEELSERRIRRVVRRNVDKDGDSIARELVRSANRAGGGDNISVVFIRAVK